MNKKEKETANSCNSHNHVDGEHQHNQEDHENHGDEHGHEGHLEEDNLNSFTLTGSYSLDGSLAQGEVEKRIADIVDWLGNEALDRGAPVIGHIKGWVEMEDKFRFSFVTIEEGVDLDGSLDSEVSVDKFVFKMLAVIPLDDSELDVLAEEVDGKLKNID